MKPNELMVGDWVYAIDGNGEKHPCRANNLEYDYTNKRGDFCVDFYGTGYEAEWPDVAFNVEPIPLTPEILEKNGFGEQGFERMSVWSILGFSIELDFSTWKYYWANGDVEISSVHELQHVLRLCRIDIEIEL